MYAEKRNLNSRDIIKGVLDPRIGNYYDNPSFGYGGYCLPKDTKQLKSNYNGIPEKLISATIESNKIRKKYIANNIIDKKPKVIGIYRLTMKSESDNFRSSAIHEIMGYIKNAKIKVVVYEPTLQIKKYEDYEIINDLKEFKKNVRYSFG